MCKNEAIFKIYEVRKERTVLQHATICARYLSIYLSIYIYIYICIYISIDMHKIVVAVGLGARNGKSIYDTLYICFFTTVPLEIVLPFKNLNLLS